MEDKAAKCFGVQSEEQVQAGKERWLSRIRQALVEVGRKRYRFAVVELAEYLKRSEPAISRVLLRRWESGEEMEEVRQLLAFLARPASRTHESAADAPKC